MAILKRRIKYNSRTTDPRKNDVRQYFSHQPQTTNYWQGSQNSQNSQNDDARAQEIRDLENDFAAPSAPENAESADGLGVKPAGAPDFEMPDNPRNVAPHDHSGDFSRDDLLRAAENRESGKITPPRQRDLQAEEGLRTLGENPFSYAMRKGRERNANKFASRFEDLDRKRAQAQLDAKNKENSWFQRHKKGAIGGIIGLVMGGGMFVMGGLISGPMQFIHIMHFIEDTKTFITGAQTGARMLANAATTVRWGMADGIAEGIQNSRLGIVGSKVARKSVAKLSNSGLSFDRNIVGNAKHITIDTTKDVGGNLFNESAQNRNWTDAERTKRVDLLAKRYGVDKSLINLGNDGKLNLNLDKMKYSQARRLLNNINGVKWYNIIGQVQTRLALKRVGKISWLHPIKNLEKKLLNKFSDWVEKRLEKIAAKGFGSAAEAGDAAAQKTREAAQKAADVNGVPLDEEATKAAEKVARESAEKAFNKAAEEAAEKGAKTIIKDVIAKSGSKLTSATVKSAIPVVGWILLIIQVSCMLDDLDDGLGAEKYANIVAAAQADTAELLGTASQIMSGDDLTIEDVGNMSQLKLYNCDITEMSTVADPNTGEAIGTEYGDKVCSSWWDAAPVKAELGEPYSEIARSDVPAALDDVANNKLSFGGNEMAGNIYTWFMQGLESGIGGPLAWASQLFGLPSPLDAVCFVLDKLDDLIGAVLGWALDIPPMSLLMDFIMGTETAQWAMTSLSNIMSMVMGWLRGQPLDTSTGTPSEYGAIDMYGGLFMANEQMLANGGRTLTSGETAEIMIDQKKWLAEQQAEKPLLARIFDPTDYNSTVAQVARVSNFAPADNLAATFGNVFKLFSATPKLFGFALNKIGGGNISAYDPVPYNYGVSTIAYSNSEMDKLTGDDVSFNIENNAQKVFEKIDNGSLDNSKIKKCFGVNIGKAPNYDVEQLDNENGTGWNYVDNYTKTASDDFFDQIEDLTTPDIDCSGDDMLHVRTYLMDYNEAMANLCYQGDEDDADTKRACQYVGMGDSSSVSSTNSNLTQPSAQIDLATLYEDSSNIACAAGTTDMGIQQGYHQGTETNIRLCSVDGADGTIEGVPEVVDPDALGPKSGFAMVNSRISAAFVAMIQAARAAGISNIRTNTSFRSNDEQARLVQCKPGCGIGSNPVASPGYSNHQMGVAVDVSGDLNSWMKSNGESFGFKWYGADDPPHFSPSGG